MTRTCRDYQQDAKIIKKLSNEKINDLNIPGDKYVLDDKSDDIIQKHDFISEKDFGKKTSFKTLVSFKTCMKKRRFKRAVFNA